MATQNSAVLQQQHHHFSRQSSSVDFEAAEQLLQHSRRARESNGEVMDGSFVDHKSPSEITTAFADSRDDQSFGVETSERIDDIGDSRQEARHADAPYDLLNIQTVLGQVCR